MHKKIIKTHSAAIDEIGLKENLSEKFILNETSFQGYINQLSDDGNFELLRKDSSSFTQFLIDKFKTKLEPIPDKLVRFVRGQMRSFFLDSDVAITGANFLIADVGAIALSENEGNICRACAFPKIHIVVAGYNKIIPSINDIELLWTMFASSGNGTLLTTYNSIVFGPRAPGEPDGPEEMYLILLSNGRDAVLKPHHQRKALHCIRCNTCSRYSSVWKTAGEQAYGTPYTGPIGSILTPLMKDSKTYRYLSHCLYIERKNRITLSGENSIKRIIIV